MYLTILSGILSLVGSIAASTCVCTTVSCPISGENYITMGIRKIKQLSSNKNCKYFDLKSIFNRSDVDFQL